VKSTLFVSSVQKELQIERRAVKEYIHGDPLLQKYFDVFLFEDLPAQDRRADDLYLDEVDKCGVYLGLFGNEYGWEDSAGLSPTEREFDRATEKSKYRVILVKGTDDGARHLKMKSLIAKAAGQLVRRRFTDVPSLRTELYASLVAYLAQKGELRTLPFDATGGRGATLDDISEEKLKWFLGVARHERGFVLGEDTPVHTALTHLNLLIADQPIYAALLLFAKNPQRFVTSSEVKCLHYYGTQVQKPIPSYQTYKGTLFDQIDQALDFVMAKLNRTVGTRSAGPTAPVEYEVPKDVISEALVNAVVHRDYNSNAAVQVELFADRLEVANPGHLPPELTPEKLRRPHSSIPHNPLIAEPMFLAHYIEKAGTGTVDMIARCQQAGLPEPTFEQRGGQFVVTIWRDWLTEAVKERLGLNERQRKALILAKTAGRLTNTTYQDATGASRATAKRDLEELVAKGVLLRSGRGRGASYIISTKRLQNGSNGS
jgi:ATP-dependent DNA helicase RecG